MFNLQKPNFGFKVAEFLDLPLDTVMEWPRVSVSGNRRIMIQNHRGVIEYDRSLVRINSKFGEIRITGNDLCLVSAFKEEIAIEGKVERIEFCDWR